MSIAHRTTIAVATLALLAAPAAALGQAQAGDHATIVPGLGTGARIRIETNSVRGESLIGALTEVNQGYVVAGLQGNGAIAVPWSRISRLSYASGRERSSGTVTGVLAGLAATLIVYPALSQNSRSAAAATAIALPIAGGILGRLAAPEHWEHIVWRPPQDTVMESEATRLRLQPQTELLVRPGGTRRQTKVRVIAITDDSLVVRRESTDLRYAWPQVSELRVRDSRSRTRGVAMGFSASAIVSGVRILVDPPKTSSEKQTLILSHVLVGGAIGAIVGAPGWARIPVPR